MPVIASIDGPTRRIFLHADTLNAVVSPMDIYKEMRTLRAGSETLRKFKLFLSASGNVPKGGGKFTERLVTCLLGTRIVPYDATGYLTLDGQIITDAGTEGVACFDRTSLVNQVDINYVPQQVEVIVISGGSGLDAGQDAKLTSIYNGIQHFVHCDPTLVPAGDGSAAAPFNTMAGAVSWATTKGFRDIKLLSNVTLDTNVQGFTVHGVGRPTITGASYSLAGSDLNGVKIAGTTTGQYTASNCEFLNNYVGLHGTFNDCGIAGDVTFDTDAFCIFNKCYSSIPGSSRPTFNYNSGACDVGFRGWTGGGIELRNVIAGSSTSIESVACEVRLAATCTGGDLQLRGSYFLENLGTIVPTTRSLIHPEDVEESRRLLKNRYVVDPATGIATIRNDDDSGDLLTAPIKTTGGAAWSDPAEPILDRGTFT